MSPSQVHRHQLIVVAVAATLSIALSTAFRAANFAPVGSRASLVGRAEAGGGLAGVAVTARLEAGGVLHEVTTGSDGAYEFHDLPDGTYRVDFDLVNFNVVRRNGVRVHRDLPTRVDATMRISAMCECVEAGPIAADLRERVGTVVTEGGHGLPHALLEVKGSAGLESAYADQKGRFRLVVPAGEFWNLTASDSGFRASTQRVSGASTTPLLFRLPTAAAGALPEAQEMKEHKRGCRCAGDIFRHPSR